MVRLKGLKTEGLLLSLSVALALILAGCGDTAPKRAERVDNSANNASVVDLKKGVKPEPDSEVAVIEMENPVYGRMVIELYPNIAPKMVEQFKKLIKDGFYSETTFHRIDPQLGIIQGGDPLSKDDNPYNDGAGDSPYPNVPGEYSDVPFDSGIVGAARKGGPSIPEAEARNTNNCQFFITLKRVPAFDQNYVVFGKVVEGMDNAYAIARAPVLPPQPGSPEATHPAEKIVIKSITLQPRNK